MTKILTKEEWRRRRRVRSIAMTTIIALLMLTIITFSLFIVAKILSDRVGTNHDGKKTLTETLSNGEVIKVKYLTPSRYSRPQTQLKRINGIVIHYTANPGTTADNNRSYFEGLKDKKTTYASSHYIIGIEGEIIQCIPLTEISYASNERNDDTIAIECCHPDETGEFTEETYRSLVSLTAALCMEFDLKKSDILRHYDVTQKLCPLYYVENEEAWEIFKEDVMQEVALGIQNP
jgi:N-acetylmuramoyl-L-alanine amidase CwlA